MVWFPWWCSAFLVHRAWLPCVTYESQYNVWVATHPDQNEFPTLLHNHILTLADNRHNSANMGLSKSVLWLLWGRMHSHAMHALRLVQWNLLLLVTIYGSHTPCMATMQCSRYHYRNSYRAALEVIVYSGFNTNPWITHHWFPSRPLSWTFSSSQWQWIPWVWSRNVEVSMLQTSVYQIGVICIQTHIHFMTSQASCTIHACIVKIPSGTLSVYTWYWTDHLGLLTHF